MLSQDQKSTGYTLASLVGMGRMTVTLTLCSSVAPVGG
jgi:hypothetical protein